MANIAVVFHALADPTRRELMERLAKRPLAVGELAKGLPVTRSAVSQHLKVLKGSGLVLLHRSGNRHLYQVDPRGVEAIRKYLDRIWDKALFSYKSFVESSEE